MKRIALALAATTLLATTAYAAPQVAGTYNCDECSGYLEIKPASSNVYSVKLMVSGGSCGGEVVAKGKSSLTGNKLVVPYKEKKKSCATTLSFDGKGAIVTDSCHSVASEANSTCATLGRYTRN